MGKTLHELMGWDGPMTDRQFRVWNAWIDLQWNRPSREDHYLMQVAAEARKGWVKDPNRVKVQDMRIVFQDGSRNNNTKKSSSKSREATPNERMMATQAAKARWQAMMGKPVASTPPTIQPTYKVYQDSTSTEDEGRDPTDTPDN